METFGSQGNTESRFVAKSDSDPAEKDDRPQAEKSPGDTPEQSTEPTSESDPNAPASAANINAAEATPDNPVEEDELPEWEPMTPELAEEEAMRGDFMLRWAVVLMALLMGFTEIATTETLTHIKTGEELAANGFLPGQPDSLSYTAEGNVWTNLAWGFDIIASKLYALQGMRALTLFKAVCVAIAFGVLVHTSLANIPTWWSSICAALALVACYPRFTATPDVITLLGLALTLSFLHGWTSREKPGFPWKLPVLFLVWCNLDSRMFLGLLVVIAYAIGRTLAGSKDNAPGIGTAWITAVVCTVAACVNPFTFQTLLQPVELFRSDYPTQQLYHTISSGMHHLQFYPVFHPGFFSHAGIPEIATLVLAIVALVVFVLNLKNLDLGYFFILLAFVGVGCLANHEMAATALVSAGIASVIGQRYYKSSFNQEYTIETSELLFARGGRAVTVIGMFALAFLFASGRLAGQTGPRVGLGLEPNLAAAIDGLEQDLEPYAEEMLFHFTPEQGDMLIWLGRQSFVDNRVSLYSRGDQAIVKSHNETRMAMRGGSKDGQSDVWKSTFQNYDLSLAIPRLFGNFPDVGTFESLRSSDDWQLVKLGASAAVFATKESAKRADDLVKLAFRTPIKNPPERPDWGRERGFNEKYLYPARIRRPVSHSQARSYFMELLAIRSNMAGDGMKVEEFKVLVGQITARAFLGIRAANQCLSDDPQNADAYYILASLYDQLNLWESNISPAAPQELRYLQIVGALRQCLKIEPDHFRAQQLLSQTFLTSQRADAALPLINKQLEAVAENLDDLSADAFDAHREKIKNRDKLATLVLDNANKVDDILAQATGPDQQKAAALQLAAIQRKNGFVVKALEILEDDSQGSTLDYQAQVLYGLLLLENGDVEGANIVLTRLEGIENEFPEQLRNVQWQFAAGASCLTNGQYTKAASLWAIEARKYDEQRVPVEMSVSQVALTPGIWFSPQYQGAINGMIQLPVQAATSRMYLGLCYLEEGRTNEAKAIFTALLDNAPEAPYAPLAAFYLSQINGKQWQAPDFGDEFIQIAEAPVDENATGKEEGGKDDDGKDDDGKDDDGKDDDGKDDDGKDDDGKTTTGKRRKTTTERRRRKRRRRKR